jgi:hypothetical protein
VQLSRRERKEAPVQFAGETRGSLAVFGIHPVLLAAYVVEKRKELNDAWICPREPR